MYNVELYIMIQNAENNGELIKVCGKYDINLNKNKINNNFILDFSIENPNINVYNIVNFSLYKLIADLNQDILERIEIINIISEDTECDLLFLFKPFSKELGMSKKYMYIKTIKTIENNVIKFMSYDLDISRLNVELPGYEKITSEVASLVIKILSHHSAKVTYEFNININEDLPLYMQNMSGLMMKKLFYKLKTFIEMAK